MKDRMKDAACEAVIFVTFTAAVMAGLVIFFGAGYVLCRLVGAL